MLKGTPYACLATLDLSRTRRLNFSKLNTSSRTTCCDAAINICAAQVIDGQRDLQMLSQHARQHQHPGMHTGNMCSQSCANISCKTEGTPVNANSLSSNDLLQTSRTESLDISNQMFLLELSTGRTTSATNKVAGGTALDMVPLKTIHACN